MASIKAIALNATLKPSNDEASSTEAMISLLENHFAQYDVKLTKTVRLADYNIKPGVSSDEGKGDQWLALRNDILAHDILIFGTPVWLGQISSLAKRALERMNAFLAETDDEGRMPSFGKVAVAAIVGNEDGAHNCSAQLFQALNDTGWTIPPIAACYWVGKAMGSTDFKELESTPKQVSDTANMVAANAAHLAKLLKNEKFPALK